MKNKSINNNIFNYLIYTLAILNVIFYLIYNLYIELIQFLLFVILGYVLYKRNIIFIIIVGVILINTILIDKIYNRKNIIEGNEGQDEGQNSNENTGNNDVDPQQQAEVQGGAETLAAEANETTDGDNGSGSAGSIGDNAHNDKNKIQDIVNGL